ncbi:MAG: TolC family protein [Bdellovibrionales bacterium]|nr:hypothetical protein [Pseudobdellovibrionaceae bacterium]MCB0406893.1 TolC family protein [Bdellovibrionales bacterium]MCB9026369.1 TolC family protein [Pseudobdellovibrionaceae bacterium]|tara:strand:- start:37699 stop:38988 length:1290 start_codon:yes stop_codon:yes gene_type:complete
MLKVFLVFSLICTPAMAQEVALSLDQAIEKAKNYSPEMKLQANQIEKIRLEKRSVLGEALPNVSTSYNVNNYIDKPVINGFSLNSKYERTFDFTIRQALFRFGSLSGSLNAARIALGIASLEKSMVERDITYATKVAYYSSLLAKKQLEISSSSLQNAKQNLKILQNYFSSGRPPQGDLIRLQADIASRKSQLEEAKFNQELAHTQLRTLLGIDNSQPLQLTDEFESNYSEVSKLQMRKDLEENQPQVQALRKQIEYQEELSRVQRAKTLPRLDAVYSFSSSDRSNGEIFDKDSNVSSSLVGVTLTWDIWSGGTNRANYKKALADKNRAEILLSHQRNQLLSQFDAKVDEYNTLRTNLLNDKQSVKLAEQSFRLSQNKFKTGKVSVTDLNNNEALLTQAKLTHALHQYQLAESLATIRKLVSYQAGETK